jgi:hypothetical protein
MDISAPVFGLGEACPDADQNLENASSHDPQLHDLGYGTLWNMAEVAMQRRENSRGPNDPEYRCYSYSFNKGVLSGRLAYEVQKEDGLLARMLEGPKYRGS